MDRTSRQAASTAPSPWVGGRFDLAKACDEPEIRRVFRENPMDGAIRLSLEPAGSADPLGASIGRALLSQTVVGRRCGGGLFGFGTRSVRIMYINGQPVPVGYLSGLRVDADHRANPRVILRGYELFRQLHDADRACAFYLTSILSDNIPARRFLEASVRGMPTYRFVAEYVTLVMRVRPARLLPTEDERTASPDELSDLLQRSAGRFNFATPWRPQDLTAGAPGLAPADFRATMDSSGRLSACAAMWDQRAIRQTVVRGYAPSLRLARGVLNLVAPLFGQPRLPEVGQPIRAAFVSHLATRSENAAATQSLMQCILQLHAVAAAGKVDYLIAGGPRGHAWLDALRDRFGGRELVSRLYVVYWPDDRQSAAALDARAAFPEAALL